MSTPLASRLASWFKKAWSKAKIPALVIAWLITTGISVWALIVAIPGADAARSSQKLNEEQSNQIMELQRITPTGAITAIVPYQSGSYNRIAIKDIRHNPVVPGQINDISGDAENVPDNGDLFMVVHNYGRRTNQLAEKPSLYFITPVNQLPPPASTGCCSPAMEIARCLLRWPIYFQVIKRIPAEPLLLRQHRLSKDFDCPPESGESY